MEEEVYLGEVVGLLVAEVAKAKVPGENAASARSVCALRGSRIRRICVFARV